MLRYFIKILFLCIAVGSFAQEQKLPKREVFIRSGVDLSRFILPYMNDITVSGFELSVDAEIKYNFFPIVEFGMNTIEDNTELHNYTAEGSYWRVGLNYNMLKYQHRLDQNIFFIGARYARSLYWQQSSNITFENEWGVSTTNLPKNNLNLTWVEAVIGIRGEVYKNFFLGYTIRVKGKISSSDDNNITPYFIPGYGSAIKNIRTGMSFTASYAIPIIRIKDNKNK